MGAQNYTFAFASGTLNVTPAVPAVTVSDLGGPYNGSPYAATAMVAGVISGLDSTPASSLEGVVPRVTYYAGATISGSGSTATPSVVGTYTAVASFAGIADYTAASSAPVTFAITPVTLYWDPNLSRSTSGGGSGTWADQSAAVWYDPAAQKDIAWCDGNQAVFAGGAGTVTISGSVSATLLQFLSTGYVIQSGTLSLTGGTGIDVEAASATISSAIGGGGAFTKSGSGAPTLTGNNTYSGGMTIGSGTLQVGNWGSTGTLGSGNVVDDGSLTFCFFNTVTVANAISGTGSVTQSSWYDSDGGDYTGGTLILTGNNTYAGGTVIDAASTLQVGSAAAVGTLGSGTVTGEAPLSIGRAPSFDGNGP